MTRNATNFHFFAVPDLTNAVSMVYLGVSGREKAASDAPTLKLETPSEARRRSVLRSKGKWVWGVLFGSLSRSEINMKVGDTIFLVMPGDPGYGVVESTLNNVEKVDEGAPICSFTYGACKIHARADVLYTTRREALDSVGTELSRQLDGARVALRIATDDLRNFDAWRFANVVE